MEWRKEWTIPIPLFLVAGLSGAGKTTVVPVVSKLLGKGFNVYDMDDLVENNNFQAACNLWLRIVYFNSRCGNHTILFGSIPYAYQPELCEDYAMFSPVCKLLLHCNDSVRTIRLEERGGVWKEGNNLNVALHAAQGMYQEATALQIPIVDTSTTPIEIVAQQVKDWIISKIVN